MAHITVRRYAASLAGAIVLLLQISPVLAAGQPDHARPVEITFTKWVTTAPLLAGFTGGDVVGIFAGEVLESQVTMDLRIVKLEAVYEVRDSNRSFTALIRGGRTNNPGAALLEGVILSGWRTGAKVQVEFQVVLPPSPTESGCLGAPAGIRCFQGTIRVGRVPRN